jgi:hypothetical protein
MCIEDGDRDLVQAADHEARSAIQPGQALARRAQMLVHVRRRHGRFVTIAVAAMGRSGDIGKGRPTGERLARRSSGIGVWHGRCALSRGMDATAFPKVVNKS